MATSTPSVPNSLRREVGDIPQILPNAGISNFNRGVAVVPQQYIQNTANALQTSNFIAALGQFNDGLTKFGAAYHKYDTAQNTLQGEADAATMDPEQRKKLFADLKGNVDRAVEEGILPKSMHPVYKMTLMENSAKSYTAQELPQVLQAERQRLTDAGATNIGGQLAQISDKWVKDTFSGDPLSMVAASNAAKPITLNTQTQFQAQSNANFDFKLDQSFDNNWINNAEQLIQTYKDGDENLRPALYDQLSKANAGDKDPNGRIGKNFKVMIENLIDRGASAADVKQFVQDASLHIKSGSGLWADTAVGRATLHDLSDTILSHTTKQGTLARELRNDSLKMTELDAEAEINSKMREGLSVDKQGRDQLVDSLTQKYPFLSKQVIQLKVDTAYRSNTAALDSEKADPNRVSRIEDLIRTNPKQALVEIDSQVQSKILPVSVADKLREKAKASNDEYEVAKDADGFKKLESLIKDNVESMVPKKGALGGLDQTESPEQVQKRVALVDTVKSFGQTAILAATRRTMDEFAASGQEMDKNSPAFKLALDKNLNEALKRTNDFAVQRGKNLDAVTPSDTEELGEFTAPMLMVGRMVKDINTKAPADITVDDKIALQRVPELKRDILNSLRYGTTEKQKQQAATAYALINQYTGYSPQSIIKGVDEFGIPIDKKMIDPKNGLFFQNEAQYNQVAQEYRKVQQEGGDLTKTTAGQLFKALGIKKEEQAQFLSAQQYYVLKNRIPSFQELISDPTEPKGTKVDAGLVKPSLANPFPSAAVPSIAPQSSKTTTKAKSDANLTPANPFAEELKSARIDEKIKNEALDAGLNKRAYEMNQASRDNEKFQISKDLTVDQNALPALQKRLADLEAKRAKARSSSKKAESLAQEWESISSDIKETQTRIEQRKAELDKLSKSWEELHPDKAEVLRNWKESQAPK